MKPASRLIERATALTSLHDFGEDSFREGLERLVKALDSEARLNQRGQEFFEAQIIDLLSRRLEIEYWYREHPEIDDQEIVAPLIGLGLPRTGSTALGALLAEDPAVRSLRVWEAARPCPPPDAATLHCDPRIVAAEAAAADRDALAPRKKAMLPSSATSPAETQTLMGFDFQSQLFQAFARIPSYTEWFYNDADLVPTYRYVKRVLKLLQSRCPPRRWRLKSPTHSLFLDALAEVFPDARFWMTHRDVGKVVPSMADLYYEISKPFVDEIDMNAIGRTAIEFCELAMLRTMKFRDAGNESRFFDIHFTPFQKDPFPILADLYAFLGEDFSDETRERMESWRERTPREKHGSHTYDPADFGIDTIELKRRFQFYAARFVPDADVPARG